MEATARKQLQMPKLSCNQHLAVPTATQKRAKNPSINTNCSVKHAYGKHQNNSGIMNQLFVVKM
jgi:hypothetical protein